MNTIKPGDCFFNVKRFSCLRVKRVYEAHVEGIGCPPGGQKVWYADAMTWRPDGCKRSNDVRVRLDSLTRHPYQPMRLVGIYTTSDYHEMDVASIRTAGGAA